MVPILKKGRQWYSQRVVWQHGWRFLERKSYSNRVRSGWRDAIYRFLVQFACFGYIEKSLHCHPDNNSPRYINSFGVYQDFYVRKYLTKYTPSAIGYVVYTIRGALRLKRVKAGLVVFRFSWIFALVQLQGKYSTRATCTQWLFLVRFSLVIHI